MRSRIALLMLVAAGVAGGCGGGAPGETSGAPKAVPVSVVRTGGIAGVNQSIEIAADGSWVYTDKRRNQWEKGTLGTDQRNQLLRLVADPAFAEQLGEAGRSAPNCADAFHYTLSAGGDPMAFEDCGSATDAPAVRSAIALVTEATPF